MRKHVQISTRFLIVGVIAVIGAAFATSAGLIWQELLTLRVAQDSYIFGLAFAGQTEIEQQKLPSSVISGARLRLAPGEASLRQCSHDGRGTRHSH